MLCLVNMSDLEALDGRARPRVVVVDADADAGDESALLEIREERCVVKAIVDDEGAVLLFLLLFDADID